MHSLHLGVSLALDISIMPGFLKCRVTHLIAWDLQVPKRNKICIRIDR